MHIPVRDVHNNIGCTTAAKLFVVHAVSGCDSTSCLYGHGKRTVYKQLMRSSGVASSINVLESSRASQQEVETAGKNIVKMLFGGKSTDSLSHLRYLAYINMIATSTQRPQPERLPPTDNAVRFHVYRVHLQVLQWKLLSTTDVPPEAWGWKFKEGRFVPIATDIDPATNEIL